MPGAEARRQQLPAHQDHSRDQGLLAQERSRNDQIHIHRQLAVAQSEACNMTASRDNQDIEIAHLKHQLAGRTAVWTGCFRTKALAGLDSRRYGCRSYADNGPRHTVIPGYVSTGVHTKLHMQS